MDIRSASSLMRPRYTSCAEHFRSQEPSPEREWTTRAAERPAANAKPGDSPFLRLPTEIRLQIYALLILPRQANDLLPSHDKVFSSTQDYFDYEKKQHGTDRPAIANLVNPTLLIRTIDPLRYSQVVGSRHARSTYSVRCDRFRARCMKTTYHCVNSPQIGQNMGILGANKQIHAEAAELLYSSYTFDFDTHVEAIEPFLQDLTPFSRSCIKSMRVVKRALAYEKEFDRCEWSTAIGSLSNPDFGLGLQKLDLGVVAGRPGVNGWDFVPVYNAGHFEVLKELEGMEWMRDLLEIKGLQELRVSPIIEHCPPASNSAAIANFIRFSASIEVGLAEFLKGAMLRT